MFFLLFLLDDRRIRIRTSLTNEPGGPTTYGSYGSGSATLTVRLACLMRWSTWLASVEVVVAVPKKQMDPTDPNPQHCL